MNFTARWWRFRLSNAILPQNPKMSDAPCFDPLHILYLRSRASPLSSTLRRICIEIRLLGQGNGIWDVVPVVVHRNIKSANRLVVTQRSSGHGVNGSHNKTITTNLWTRRYENVYFKLLQKPPSAAFDLSKLLYWLIFWPFVWPTGVMCCIVQLTPTSSYASPVVSEILIWDSLCLQRYHVRLHDISDGHI